MAFLHALRLRSASMLYIWYEFVIHLIDNFISYRSAFRLEQEQRLLVLATQTSASLSWPTCAPMRK